jgi:molecular chaperone GrpE
MDELTLAVKHAEAGGNSEDLSEGFKMVEKNLGAALETVGVERIEALGMQFDPTLHEAVEKTEGSVPGEELVVEELRAGYTLKGQVLRPSMVRVGPAPKEPGEEGK